MNSSPQDNIAISNDQPAIESANATEVHQTFQVESFAATECQNVDDLPSDSIARLEQTGSHMESFCKINDKDTTEVDSKTQNRALQTTLVNVNVPDIFSQFPNRFLRNVNLAKRNLAKRSYAKRSLARTNFACHASDPRN